MGELKFAKQVPQTDANCILKDFAEIGRASCRERV